MRRDWRWVAVAITVAAVAGGGLLLQRREATPRADDLTQRFNLAVMLLHAHRDAEAEAAWQRVLALAPQMPEAHVNLGFALLGQKRPAEARTHFERATDLRPEQANAYYGLALAFEAQGDMPLATGAMRSYLHLARDESPEHLRRARAALWEWESTAQQR